ncbi:uncharacterized protein LOC141706422 [Apium graveolens]|uniref:uncharacterized protein LOC141706422 n=1 Tax=Apium graveolens TaxID=4045 RepID=UPI003D7A3850
MGDVKASGPDGYSACFFKKAWPVIGVDICLDVQDFFRTGKLLKEVNATLISLIPKVEYPSVVGQFRPIALCNVLYKCITKIIADRIKDCLGSLVDDTQNAFIPGRRISDNILLTQEILNNYHRKMVNWIRECIYTPSYSIILNGEMHGYFRGEKGLRQGDPLSPYLFTLVMQVLSLIIKQRISEEGNFKFHPKFKKKRITHLSFADDLFLFCAADPYFVNLLKDAMDKFGRCSGLWPNKEKSNVFLGNVGWDAQLLIQNILEFNEGVLPIRYLRWVNEYRIRRRSFWDIEVAWDASWRIREEIHHFIHIKIGNGQNTNFWFDTWVLDQPLSNWCSHRDILAMRSNKSATMNEFFRDGSWEWPADLISKCPGLNQVWEDIRFKKSVVLRWNLIWFPKSIPKHCFTLDRLEAWQVMHPALCSFCSECPDSREHLFFSCEFCHRVLIEFQKKGYCVDYQGNWGDFIRVAASKWRGRSLHSLINKLVYAAIIYHIWHERNRRIFQNQRKRPWQIVADVEDDIFKKLMGLSVARLPRVQAKLHGWDVGVLFSLSLEVPSIQILLVWSSRFGFGESCGRGRSINSMSCFELLCGLEVGVSGEWESGVCCCYLWKDVLNVCFSGLCVCVWCECVSVRECGRGFGGFSLGGVFSGLGFGFFAVLLFPGGLSCKGLGSWFLFGEGVLILGVLESLCLVWFSEGLQVSLWGGLDSLSFGLFRCYGVSFFVWELGLLYCGVGEGVLRGFQVVIRTRVAGQLGQSASACC